MEDGAKLGAGVEIGPFCHIGPHVTIGDGVRLVSHVSVAGRHRRSARARGFSHSPRSAMSRRISNIGARRSRLTIGEDCLIREGVTMNPGTAGGGSETIVGPRCVLLANAHVAHDCRLGEGVILSNNVMLAGHCQIGDFAIVSGGAAAHQFVRIGAHAFVGGLAGVENDIIPFGMALGNRASLAGLNVVGLKRRGFSHEAIHELRRAYRMLFSGEGTLKERVERRCGSLSRPGSRAADRRFPAPGRRSADLRSACRQGRRGVSDGGGRGTAPPARDSLRRRQIAARGRRAKRGAAVAGH